METSLELGIIWYVIFVFSTSLHEAAHALASYKLGDSTAFRGGQVTANPYPHMEREPIGMIVVPIISFLINGWMIGWASAPYDPYWADRYPKKAAWMSLAGPAANLALVVVSFALIRAGLEAGYFQAPEVATAKQITVATEPGIAQGLAIVLSITLTLNLLLFVFNLLPVPPLDGSGALPLFMEPSTARQYLQVVNHPSVAFAGLFIAWNLFRPIFSPVQVFVLNLLYPGAGYH